ncbi:MAG: AIR synthase [Clostridia bacterium]|jgi:hydrogenase expression/formation protein HypE|nr:AIR synthase [Clostridia bacterium]MBT7122637.1 AIR synthase [Clostridia bacterium]
MKIGKLTNEQLKELVLDKLNISTDALLQSGVGEDCAALDFNGQACVLSTDPITGAVDNIGALAVHVSGNDVASSGAQPSAILVTLLVPPDKQIADIQKVIDELIETSAKLGIDIIGGHTEITDAVTRIVISTTVIGRVDTDKLIKSSGANVGDDIIMTKYAAIEGTYIIASERADDLRDVLSDKDKSDALNLINQISVIHEGMIATHNGATAMHDITEGGVFGAVHELCEASNLGCVLNSDNIPILDVTQKICDHFNINPNRLIGSGSMLITTANSKIMLKALCSQGIKATIIGQTTKRVKTVLSNGIGSELSPPQADELFSI